MELNEYQSQASSTDQYAEGSRGEAISLFGLIGEIGSLLTTFKKRLRDKDAYQSFHADLREELGDVLWYLANLSKKYHMNLEEIAQFNLAKTKSFWGYTQLDTANYSLYDLDYDEVEQIPRKFCVKFDDSGISDAGFNKVRISVEGIEIGDPLTDNSFGDDGYRYHDCFHLAYAAILGWSPVLRRMKGCKRSSNPQVDDVEDGARASFTEEFVALYTYNYARDHNYLDGTEHVDSEVLRTIVNLVRGFEVSNRSAFEWRVAITKSFDVFRQLRDNNGGIVECDLEQRKIEYRKV